MEHIGLLAARAVALDLLQKETDEDKAGAIRLLVDFLYSI